MMVIETWSTKPEIDSSTTFWFPIKKLDSQLQPCVGENSFPKKMSLMTSKSDILEYVGWHEFSKSRFAMFRGVFEEVRGHMSSSKEIFMIFKTSTCQKLKISTKNRRFSEKSKNFKLVKNVRNFNGKHTVMRAFDRCRPRSLTPKT